MPSEHIKNLWFSDFSKEYKKFTLISTGLILVVYRNYKVYNPSDLKTIDLENKIWNFKFRIFKSKLLIRCIL